MESTLDILTRKLDRDVRQQCQRRYSALVRQYQYLHDSKSEYLFYTLKRGWFLEKYKVLFSLNTFYQIVIGPLASSTRGVSDIGIGSTIPIHYGASLSFNTARNKTINKMYNDYIAMVGEFRFKEWWLVQNQSSDIVYQVAKHLEDNG